MGLRRRRTIARADVMPTDALGQMITEVIARRARGIGMSPWELPIVVACRRLIADTLGQMPLIDMKYGQRTRVQPPLLVRPDPNEPRWLTMSRIVDNLTGYGYAWLIPTAWDAADYPSALRAVDAGAGSPAWNEAGDLDHVTYMGRELTPGPLGVIWLPYEVPQRGHPGQSPMARCWRAVEYLAALYEMAGSFWEAGFPSIAVTVQNRMSPDDTAKLKDQVLGAWARKHEPAVLDNGAVLSPVGSTAVEAELVSSIGMANAEIARTFGVMPSLVNVAAGDALTYSTTESEARKWKAYGLGSYMMRIESAFSDLSPYLHVARFDPDELTRTDFVTRARGYAVALGNAPWLTLNEVRGREGEPPIEGGDVIPVVGGGDGAGGELAPAPELVAVNP